MNVYIIKKKSTIWDGCNGVDSFEEYLNWIYATEEEAKAKADKLTEKFGSSTYNGHIEYLVEKQEVIGY